VAGVALMVAFLNILELGLGLFVGLVIDLLNALQSLRVYQRGWGDV